MSENIDNLMVKLMQEINTRLKLIETRFKLIETRLEKLEAKK